MATPLLSTLLTLIGLFVALASGRSGAPPARLPQNVGAAVVYNEIQDRWHAGVWSRGDRPDSVITVLCLTPARKVADITDHLHSGINISVRPGETEELWGWRFDWAWEIDGRRLAGAQWRTSRTTSPATVEAVDDEAGAALYNAMRRAQTAVLIGAEDGEERLRVHFDLPALFRTPAQFALDECNRGTIEQQTGSYHSAYAYYDPESTRHRITLTAHDSETQHRLIVHCGPNWYLDDDAQDWMRNTVGEVIATVTLLPIKEEGGQLEVLRIASATVSWQDGGTEGGGTVWPDDGGWLDPPAAQENLRFLDVLRRSEELQITIHPTGSAPDSPPIEFTVNGSALFAKPLGAELEACIQEYAKFNGG